MKRKPQHHPNLFEPQKIEEPPPKTEPSSPPKIKDACPQCGGRSLKTVRPFEHNNHTHYCATICLSEDRTEAFYFTPKAESFAEAAGREEARKVVAEAVIGQEFEKLAEARRQEAEIDIPVEVSASKYDQEKLFTHEVKEATGKTIESLEYSRERATEVMRRFKGYLPQSIMKADKRSRGEADLAVGTYTATEKYSGAFAKSSSGCRYGALSAFPQNIAQCVIELYSEKGQTVVDPFAGHNSRMEACVRAGRNYIGCDVSAKFMQFNRERAELLRSEYPKTRIELHETDSRKMDSFVEQWVGDFTLTSPPYYDIEYYGDEYQQLGKAPSYAEFLRGLGKVAEQNFRALKSGAFCVWFINDFRDDGVFNPYHIDTFNLLKAAGFVAWDMMIVDFGGSFGQCFPVQVVERKILPKRHEYGVVMRKL